MMFDITYRIGQPVIETQPNEDGEVYEAQIVAPILAALPAGPNQLAFVPMGILRLPVNADIVDDLAQQLGELQKIIKRQSQVQTASSMSDVEMLAAMQRQTENLRA